MTATPAFDLNVSQARARILSDAFAIATLGSDASVDYYIPIRSGHSFRLRSSLWVCIVETS